jgi:hypothetical protein
MSTSANKLFDQAKAPAERYVLGESIVASAESGTMSIPEIQHVIAGLTEILQVRAAKHGAASRRIERLNAQDE